MISPELSRRVAKCHTAKPMTLIFQYNQWRWELFMQALRDAGTFDNLELEWQDLIRRAESDKSDWHEDKQAVSLVKDTIEEDKKRWVEMCNRLQPITEATEADAPVDDERWRRFVWGAGDIVVMDHTVPPNVKIVVEPWYQCACCQNFRGRSTDQQVRGDQPDIYICPAFPKGIPEDLFYGRQKHDKLITGQATLLQFDEK